MTGNKRTKSGCITCRIRRVKCDETKPTCQRCTSTGRKCDGYSILPYSRNDLLAPPQRVNDLTFDDVWEKRCFQFFRHKTVNSTNALLDARFWDRVVLQAAHSEPAIKHGILALSTFHQLLSADRDSSVRQRLWADQQYQLCLQHARELLSKAGERDIERVLITCIICIHYEAVRGQFKASNQHMNNGRAIMRQYTHKIRKASNRSDLAEIQQAFSRLDAACGSFTNRSVPYQSTMDNFYDTAPFLTAWKFANVHEARNCLFDLSRWLLLSRHQMYDAWRGSEVERLAKYEAEKNASKARLMEWYSQFEPVAQDATSDAEPIVLALQMWYTAVYLLVEPDIFGPETRFDQYMDHFERLISLGEQIAKHLSQSEHNHFSYDIGYTTPMFFAAHRCRDPQLRRRAISVLRAIPRQEGNFLSLPAADVVEKLVQHEEGGQLISVAADVLEERRVWFVALEFDFDEGEVEAEFFTMPPGAEDFHVIVEHVYWTPIGGRTSSDSP